MKPDAVRVKPGFRMKTAASCSKQTAVDSPPGCLDFLILDPGNIQSLQMRLSHSGVVINAANNNRLTIGRRRLAAAAPGFVAARPDVPAGMGRRNVLLVPAGRWWCEDD